MEFILPKECHGCANSADGRNSKFEAHEPTLFNPNVGLISVNESIFRKQSNVQLVHKYSAKHLCADHPPKLQQRTSGVSSLRTTNHPSVNRQVQNLLADTTNNIKTQSHLIPQIPLWQPIFTAILSVPVAMEALQRLKGCTALSGTSKRC
jgi:hypothetical protein